jgi:4-amino-4-deoxy-L-arabinose transferase-like glycosyltransferase
MSSDRPVRSRQLLACGFAALAIAARLPFLITGKIPFDSDEAVEGLMARHVLDGELAAFFWGQAYKGVPEVYVSAAAFAMFGSSVTVLKSVTLLMFAIYVALNFILLEKLASRGVAACASLLLIAAPPALVFWSLAASAEYVIIMLAGTALLLVTARAKNGEQTTTRASLFVSGLLIGFGLWVHQLFIVYLVPLR